MDFEKVKKINGIHLYLDINLEKYTTIKLANTGNIAVCSHLDSLLELIKYLKNINYNYHLVGWGANQVLHNTKDKLFIKLNFDYDKDLLSEPRDEYILPASVSLNTLTSHALKFGLRGWEVFTGIPASLGGAICMNAGTALGEIGDLIKSVDILGLDGDVYTYVCSKESFGYRTNHFLKPGDIIIGAKITHDGLDEQIKMKIKEYLEYRKNTQPLTTKNCGSVFKNYSNEVRAGTTIDRLGLKEFGFDHLRVSPKHANFIENLGGASSEEFNELVECLKIDIERYTGLKFELEVKVY